MNILELPTEIVARIFEYLEDRNDVFSARQSSKNLDRASFALFGRRFFRKKGFMLTTPSLNVLQQIAAHEGLRKYVQHIWFNPDLFTFRKLQFGTPMDEKAEGRRDAYSECMEDHKRLLHTPALETELTTALQAFPNLVTIGMRRSEAHSPYGWSKLYEAIGEDPRQLGSIPDRHAERAHLSTTTILFSALIRAIAATDIRLQRLYTDAIEIDSLLPQDLPQHALEKTCASLLYIEINAIKGAYSQKADGPPAFKSLHNPQDFGVNLARFFAAAPQLKEVGMQIFPDLEQRHMMPPEQRQPESWRDSYPSVVLSRLVARTTFAHLTRVKLEKFTTSSETLQAFLEPSASSLTSLKLRDIRLLSSKTDRRPWWIFFSFLVDQCTALDHLLLFHLLHDRGGVAFIKHTPGLSREVAAELSTVDSMPLSLVNKTRFMDFQYITLQETGRQMIRVRLEEVRDQHWYHQPLACYALDEDQWHTDTSDEEW